jgi:hypothetical protein
MVGSKLKYEVVSLLGYKLKPNMTLEAGWLYLKLDYVGSGTVAPLVNATLSDLLLDFALNLK